MHLQWLDWVIAIGSILICFVPALFYGRRSGKNTTEFFAAGRSVPWWLAGLSMVGVCSDGCCNYIAFIYIRRIV